MARRPIPQILIATALLTALLMIGQPALAQGGKIGVLNTQAVVLESKAGKAALAPLEALRQEKQELAQAMSQEIKDLRTRIAEGQAMPVDQLAELRTRLEEKTQQIQRFQQDTAAELQKRQGEVLAEIDRQVMPVVNAYALEQGYSLIFRKFESGLVYVDETIDITAAIIQRLDAR